MKILITGSQSYIGEKVSDFIKTKEPEWIVSQLDVKTAEWKKCDFSSYDTVLHVAGLAHQKVTIDIESLYYEVNRDLAVEVAKKAKESGIKQFIFMSSMSVYSDNLTYINLDSPTYPDNAYGKSKLQAEEIITRLSSDSFIISIVRPPMIYGKGCKGNYNLLRNIALKFPIFPKVNNKRSMLFIDNLSELILQLIVQQRGGLFYPQNAELVNTTKWVKYIAAEHGKRVYASILLGLFVKIGMFIPGIKGYCIKAFGDSCYDEYMSTIKGINYQLVSFRESIHLSEYL